LNELLSRNLGDRNLLARSRHQEMNQGDLPEDEFDELVSNISKGYVPIVRQENGNRTTGYVFYLNKSYSVGILNRGCCHAIHP